MTFDQILNKWMTGLDLNPYGIAPRLGVAPQTVYNWLDGHLPPTTKIAGIAAVIGVEPAKLRALILVQRRALQKPIKHIARNVARRTQKRQKVIGADRQGTHNQQAKARP